MSQDDDAPRLVPTFVFKGKGRQAAEDFLLARYRLYSQIYLHKTTRGFEQLLTALFSYIGASDAKSGKFGLGEDHPLLLFLRAKTQSVPDEATLRQFMRLDDMLVWSAIEAMTGCKDEYAADLSQRLFWRQPLEVFDLSAHFGGNSSNEEQLNAERKLERHFSDRINKSVFIDRAPLNLYSRIGGEMTKEHKKVRVLGRILING